MNRRIRRPSPQLAHEALYVRPPHFSDNWVGRRVVLHAGVKTALGNYPASVVWTVEKRSRVPACWVLRAEVPAVDGGSYRACIVVEHRQLRDKRLAGWLPL